MAAPVSVRKIAAEGLKEPPGATWSNCLVLGDEVVMSGLTARGGDGMPIGGDDMKEQTRAIFARASALLNAAGGSLANVYKLVIYVTDMSRKDDVNAARAECFQPLFPCSTLVEAKSFAFPGLLVEVDVFANLRVDMHAAAQAS